MNTKPIILVTVGDVAGIGPEIVSKTINDGSVFAYCKPVIIGSRLTLESISERCGISLKIRVLNTPEEATGEEGVLEMINVECQGIDTVPFGQVSALAGQAAFNYIRKACELLLEGRGAALVTAPINKESFKAASIPYIGHTEAVADLMHSKNPLTMFQVHKLRVFFMSRHMSLKDAINYITEERLLSFIHLCNKEIRTLGIEHPKLAVAALNPHCGEHGLFGNEEDRFIVPAVETARQQGIDVVGPIGADSVFWQALNGKYDVVLSLYHDQGHIATKTVDFDRTTSITLGLPHLRTSVDHGTAFDIAGKNLASPVSLIEAVRLAALYVK